MSKERNIRIYGVPREDIDIDLITHIVIQMGRQLAQEAMTDGVLPSADETQESEGDEQEGATP